MKYHGLREVKCDVYPNDYVYNKKGSALYDFAIFNLALCSVVGVAAVILRFFGTSANEIMEIIVKTITSNTL